MAAKRMIFPVRAFRAFTGAGGRAFSWGMDRYSDATGYINDIREAICDWLAENPWGAIVTIGVLATLTMVGLLVYDVTTGDVENLGPIVIGQLVAGTIMSLFIGAVVAFVGYALLRFIVPPALAILLSAVLFIPIIIGCIIYGLGLVLLTVLELLLLIPLVILWMGQLWYLASWHIWNTCWACSYRGQPLHECPECGTRHERLWPNLYGHLFHVCPVCAERGKTVRLPTLDILGRNKLRRYCPNCGTRRDVDSLPETLVAVVGGRKTGKTCYLMNLTRALLEGHTGNPTPMRAEDVREDDPRLDNWREMADRGEVPPLTGRGTRQPEAVVMQLEAYGQERLLFLYDAAGEEWVSIDEIEKHHQLQYVNGLIIMVDPYALEGVRERLATGDIPEHASEEDVHSLAESVKAGLDTMRADENPDGTYTVPTAVVISKMDDPHISEIIGDPGSEDPDAYYQQRLRDLGADRALNVLHRCVSPIRYFTCSALGRDRDANAGQPFEPQNVLEPFAWTLKESL